MADIHLVAAEQQDAIPGAASGTLQIVLVNNMADAALAITERRFERLLQAACPHTRLHFRCVTLPSIPRGEMAAARIARYYTSLDEIRSSRPDAVLFSGAEPIRESLRDEVFWPGLTAIFDWVRTENIPSLFSCLAAHAAVLHYAGIERRRRPQKIFGTFTPSVTANHTLLRHLPGRYQVPHSRWNDVGAADLSANGYHVLTQSAQAGVDMFVPADGTPHVFLQGHPEYEETALLGEYNRDLKRFETGQSTYKPTKPATEDPQAGNSAGGFQHVIRSWVLQRKEMVG